MNGWITRPSFRQANDSILLVGHGSVKRGTLSTVSVLYGACVLWVFLILFIYFLQTCILRHFWGIFYYTVGKNSRGKQGGINKVSCRMGDLNFALQEGGNSKNPHAHVCSDPSSLCTL